MKYLNWFENETQYQQKRDNDYEEPWVSYIDDIERVDFNKTEDEKLFDTPLTFEVLSDGLIYWKKNTSYGPAKTIEYKKNDGVWTSIRSSTAGVSINVVSGDIVQFRGNNAIYSSGSSRCNTFSGTTCQFKAKGNIMSLINDSSFSNLKTLSSSYNFVRLFQGLTGLTDASNLLLPATALTEGCYYEMFMDCTNLTGCPTILPATTLTDYCYYAMFNFCSKITSAPTLPATILTNYCYATMFLGCSKLNYIECLATDISASSCVGGWVTTVASTGTFVKSGYMSSWPSGESGIPNGWTVQDA